MNQTTPISLAFCFCFSSCALAAPELLDFAFRKMLDADKHVLRLADPDQLVELGLKGGAAFAVLVKSFSTTVFPTRKCRRLWWRRH
jgi:hypothetical protein